MKIPADLPSRWATARLDLRPLGPDDAPAWRAAVDASDAHLRPFVPFMAHEPRSLADTRVALGRFAEQAAEGRAWRQGLHLRGGGTLLGEVMLLSHPDPHTLEVGYWLHVDYLGRGYASEAVDAVIGLARRHPAVDGLVFRCEHANRASWALPAARGAARRHREPLREGWLDHWWLPTTPRAG